MRHLPITGRAGQDIEDKSLGRFSRAARELRDLGVSGLTKTIRKHGLSGTSHFVARNIRYAVADRLARRWDRRHNVDTAGSIPLGALSVTGPNHAQGNECISTSPKTFDFMMRHLPANLHGYSFIDIGSGKARTLLLAARHEFHRIIGVEFAQELVAISRCNITSFRAGWQRCRNFEVTHTDAADYSFPDTPLVVFFYNPFSKDVFTKVLGNLEKSLKARPRPCFVLYSSSNADAIDWARPLLEASPRLEELPTGRMPRYFDAIRVVRYAIFKAK